VLNYALDVAGQPNFLNRPFTAESLTNVLNIARERLIMGITNVPGSTVALPAQGFRPARRDSGRPCVIGWLRRSDGREKIQTGGASGGRNSAK
jgi:hypothetical protein